MFTHENSKYLFCNILFSKDMGIDSSESEGLFEGQGNQMGDGMGAIAIRTFNFWSSKFQSNVTRFHVVE